MSLPTECLVAIRGQVCYRLHFKVRHDGYRSLQESHKIRMIRKQTRHLGPPEVLMLQPLYIVARPEILLCTNRLMLVTHPHTITTDRHSLLCSGPLREVDDVSEVDHRPSPFVSSRRGVTLATTSHISFASEQEKYPSVPGVLVPAA